VKDIIINGVNIKRGQKLQINITIARLPTDTLIELPVFVYRSKNDGPSLLLTAGIHGDEINGIEVIRRMITTKKLMPERGTIIAIPLVNVYGFIHTSRNLPDGKDLNRCFPGGSTGSLARQIAHILMTEIIPNIDFGIDFHTGGSRLSNYPHIRATINDAVNNEIGMAFGAPFLLNSEFIDKSFRKEAHKAGKSILVYEGGESLRLDEFAIAQGMDGVKRLMKYLKMTDLDVPDTQTLVLKDSTWIRAKTSGIFSTKVSYGTAVKKNQVLAYISDPYGQNLTEVKSSGNGFVIGVNNMPVINAGDALIHLGTK
jgi:uncharacterized protein